MRRAKIVCTLGPSTSSYEKILELVRGGLDVARVNCSHGTHEDMQKLVHNVRKASEELARPVAILLDLQGPKIRVGNFPDGPVKIKKGQNLILTSENIPCTAEKMAVDYPNLPKDVKTSDRILIDDGNIELRVSKIRKTEIDCEVIVGGTVSNHKGVNLPGVKTSIPSLTEKDKEDLLFGLELDIDYVALSFVRQPADIRSVQQLIHAKLKNTPVIAKIEKPEAVENIDDIIAVAEGIMVARGDMAVELSPELVPSIQKRITHKCNIAGIPVIIATQMLESMINSPRPTRAEASDVANAVFDGADALMLSAETASGKYPIETLQIMTNIIKRAETDRESLNIRKPDPPAIISIPDAIEHAATTIAEEVRAKAICCITNSGKAALALSKFRPQVPIFAITDRRKTLQQLALIWGVKGIIIPKIVPTEDISAFVEETVVNWWNTYLSQHFHPLKKSDILVMTMGIPTMTRRKTNTVKVHVIG